MIYLKEGENLSGRGIIYLADISNISYVWFIERKEKIYLEER